MRPSHLSVAGTRPEIAECPECFLLPCACSYIAKLEPGGQWHYLYDVAAAEVGKPLPHRGGCPCPRCYSRCMASWDMLPPSERLSER